MGGGGGEEECTLKCERKNGRSLISPLHLFVPECHNCTYLARTARHAYTDANKWTT